LSRRIAARLIAAVACGVGLATIAPAAAMAQAPPPLSVTAAALYAPQTGQMLDAINSNRELPIASTTKLMTALVTLQHVHHLGTMFTQNDWSPAAVDSQIGLEPGERMSVHDLLLALMLPSADDAAEDLAYNVGHGSVPRFVAMMNAEAQALGLHHTHYSTPIGLDTPGNYSSAADLVKLAEFDLSHSAYFARIVDRRSAVLHSSDGSIYVTNRNDLLGQFPWIDGVKTGHTSGAGYVLVASGQRDGMPLISAVLGTTSEQTRDANTLAILNYGFDDFRRWTPVRQGQVMARPTVKDRPGVRVAVVAAAGFTTVLARDSHVTVTVNVKRQLTGPLPGQAVVGTAMVRDGDRILTKVPVILQHPLAVVSGLSIATRFMTRPMSLLVIVAAVGLAGLRLRAVRRRRRVDSPGRELEAA
jgi:serine-type D-Ala-D-Ala carboxypeptidase (penicillin-binding protein 5/6)